MAFGGAGQAWIQVTFPTPTAVGCATMDGGDNLGAPFLAPDHLFDGLTFDEAGTALDDDDIRAPCYTPERTRAPPRPAVNSLIRFLQNDDREEYPAERREPAGGHSVRREGEGAFGGGR